MMGLTENSNVERPGVWIFLVNGARIIGTKLSYLYNVYSLRIFLKSNNITDIHYNGDTETKRCTTYTWGILICVDIDY